MHTTRLAICLAALAACSSADRTGDRPGGSGKNDDPTLPDAGSPDDGSPDDGSPDAMQVREGKILVAELVDDPTIGASQVFATFNDGHVFPPATATFGDCFVPDTTTPHVPDRFSAGQIDVTG